MYVCMAVLGLRFCTRAFSSCGKWGPLFIAVRGPLTIEASLVAEHRLQTRRLSNCGSRAWLLRGMWDLPRPGLEPVSPALAGRFSTTAPPGKTFFLFFLKSLLNLLQYCFCFVFWFFGHQACGILAPRPGIKPASPALEGEVLNTGLPGKSPGSFFLTSYFFKLFYEDIVHIMQFTNLKCTTQLKKYTQLCNHHYSQF